ncbi:helix-turn-helix transcriptional regulator [Chryseobacterium zhengzhouense]|uniref:Helix-turn-helix transcriptional regulator n=1 Tax=Chryseobacterium zhengzhouense TaxID=1636086 RepID=A0ABW2M2Y9_9FLAO
MKLRIKEICKIQKITQQQLADKLGISRQALDLSIKNNPGINRLQEVADALNCEPSELISVEMPYYHLYNPETGEWEGIRKK